MKRFVILVSVLISTVSFSQNDIKVQTKDSTCMRILRHTYGFTNEVVNTDGTVTFLFKNVKNEARIVTNLATKQENVDYKIIK
jgi:hypothetical protein